MAHKRFMCLYRPDPGGSLLHDAEQGDVEAQAALGRLYFEGRSETTSSNDTGDVVMSSFTPAVKPDLTQSVMWLRKAANQGHADAKRLLKTVLATAKGVH